MWRFSCRAVPDRVPADGRTYGRPVRPVARRRHRTPRSNGHDNVIHGSQMPAASAPLPLLTLTHPGVRRPVAGRPGTTRTRGPATGEVVRAVTGRSSTPRYSASVRSASAHPSQPPTRRKKDGTSVATTSFPDASPRKKKTAAAPAAPARRDPTGSGAPGTAAPAGACTAHVSPGDLVVTAAEPEFARQFGLSADEICGYGLVDLLRSPAPARLRERFTALSSGRCRRFTERVTGRDDTGREFPVDVTAVAVRNPSGEIAGVVVFLRRPEDTASGGPVLNALDAQVLEGVASGESTVQMASRLYLSRQGIEYRVGQMLRRFDAPNRPALVARAHALGMFAAGQWPPRVLTERVR
ncbi:PAS domain-containing protein [Streptomyces sp. NPDC006624]|uniref:PAS domain-containing protein n=1 Tax=Streptomyces sp. NPDC006624 TaxID=3154892 RepID=UPI0033B8ECC6